MQITKKDVGWNLAATILRVAAGVIVMPIVLNKLAAEDIGLWTVFLSIGSLTYLLDFGFGDSFARNVTYVFSGMQQLKKEGFHEVNPEMGINYSLLKGLIAAMKRFYAAISILLLVLLLTIGSFYIVYLLRDYAGNKESAYLAWGLYSLITVYQLYTFYYDALLRGRGMIKVSKQILVVGNVIFIGVTTILLYLNMGLLALVLGQLVYVVFQRVISIHCFYDKDLKCELSKAVCSNTSEIFKILIPNSVKMGISALGGVLSSKSALFIGSLFLSLDDIGSYGITKQVLDVIGAVAVIWQSSFYPLMTKFRIEKNLDAVKRILIRSILLFVVVFAAGGIGLLLFGNTALGWIHSKTFFLPTLPLICFILLVMSENWISMFGGILLMKNEVPFFKASIYSGIAIVLLTLLGFNFIYNGILTMIIAPLIVDWSYQGWKWFYEVKKDLHLNRRDFRIFN